MDVIHLSDTDYGGVEEAQESSQFNECARARI